MRIRGGAAARWILASCAVTVAGGQAFAQDAAGAAAPATPPPASVHVQVYPTGGLGEPLRRQIETSVADAVREKLPKAKVTSGYQGQKPLFGDEAVEKALERSDKALAEAKERVKNLEDGALDMLDWAADEYARHLPALMVRDGNASKLIDVYVQTSIASFLSGETEASRTALRRALVLKPDLDYDPTVFPPQLEEMVIQERLLFDELGKGSVEVTARGGDPTVFINGLDRGKAPVTVDGLPAGPNVVSLVVAGVEPVVIEAKVEGGGEKVSVSGEVEVPDSKLGGPLAGTRDAAGGAQPGEPLRSAAEKLGAEALVLVLPSAGEAGLDLVAVVYDMRSAKRAARAETAVDPTLPGPDAEAMAEEMIAGAVWQPAVDLRVKSPPIWEHKYFWPAVGATAGVVVIAVVVTAVASGGLSNAEKVSIFPVLEF